MPLCAHVQDGGAESVVATRKIVCAPQSLEWGLLAGDHSEFGCETMLSRLHLLVGRTQRWRAILLGGVGCLQVNVEERF